MEKPKKPELIVISNDDYNLPNKNISLQGGFKNFRAFINNQKKKKTKQIKKKSLIKKKKKKNFKIIIFQTVLNQQKINMSKTIK